MTLSIKDRLDIADLYSKYRIALDSFDGDLYRECFTRDGAIIPGGGPRKGQRIQGTELAAFASDRSRPQGMLWNGDPYLARQAPNRVEAVCYVMSLNESAGSITIRAASFMADVIVREDGQWRFESRSGIDRPEDLVGESSTTPR